MIVVKILRQILKFSGLESQCQFKTLPQKWAGKAYLIASLLEERIMLMNGVGDRLVGVPSNQQEEYQDAAAMQV